MEMYFRVRATENEHSFHEDDIRKYAEKHDIQVIYYRKIRTGHIPTFREVKLSGPRGKLIEFRILFQDTIDEEWRETWKKWR